MTSHMTSCIAPWQSLDQELDAWATRGLTAQFWWRDDDAIAPTPALKHLLDIARSHKVPLALAVIPNKAHPELASLLASRSDVSVLQHGYSHDNHGAPGQKKSELGSNRPLNIIMNSLSSGQEALQVFDHALPVLVPPWNRIDDDVLENLSNLGFKGISTYGPRKAPYVCTQLWGVNTHVDIMDWHGSHGFVGDDVAIGHAVSHLKAKRLGHNDAFEATGLLTHHLVHDEACWAFIDAFLNHLKGHRGAEVMPLSMVAPS